MKRDFLFFAIYLYLYIIMNWTKVKPSGIVHIFAALHAVVTILCRAAGIGDELFLTILTMTMIILVCLRKNLNLEFSAVIIIVINVIGYILGTAGANLIGVFFESDLAIHAISTALTTELLGWGTIFIGDIIGRYRQTPERTKILRMPWLLAVVCIIFLFRLTIVALGKSDIISDGGLYRNTLRLLYNVPVCIILVCVNILYIKFSRTRFAESSGRVRWVSLTAFILLSILCTTFAVGAGLPFAIHSLPSYHDLVELSLVALIVEVLFYALSYIADYVWVTRQDMKAEKVKRHKAQFEYLKLKQQVNPHFLFNSLNVLDCLICENKNEDASLFVHKLSGMYRYMLKNEIDTLIPLRDELAFVGMYTDLLKVRFSCGFEVRTDVPEEFMSFQVVPCSIQMLVENALKNNRVSPGNPLYIDMVAKDNRFIVTNTISPRMASSEESTKVGLNYIRQQYIDLSGNDIEVIDDGKTYSVSLPLLPVQKTT